MYYVYLKNSKRYKNEKWKDVQFLAGFDIQNNIIWMRNSVK
jgi:hypothetical protein